MGSICIPGVPNYLAHQLRAGKGVWVAILEDLLKRFSDVALNEFARFDLTFQIKAIPLQSSTDIGPVRLGGNDKHRALNTQYRF
jgi:hypothetical protein